MDWAQWVPPHDPRRVDGAITTEDEHGRLIQTADCGQRCPGCGLCCACYRDTITADYAGTKEFEGSLRLGRGGLVELEEDLWYRVPHCGPTCPGYGCCCPSLELRRRPETVADARRILLEDNTSQLWEMQESLLILAHEGTSEAVTVLEAFMPLAHTRLTGFAECALEEGHWWADTPRTPEEARVKMKREVLEAWDLRAIDAFGRIEETEAELERLEYTLEIARRLLDKTPYGANQKACQTRVDALQALVSQTEERLEAERQDMDWCDAMVAEILADLGIDPMAGFCGKGDDQDFPF